jgi:Zn-dependent peptidase ImmA (M78 family)
MLQGRDEKIKEIVQRLLMISTGVAEAPVDVEAIAIREGAVVSYEPFKEELSGVLVKEKDRIIIGVNSSHPKTRQRFTIAHEIGHLCLEHEGEIFVDQRVIKRDALSAQAVDASEIEANRFAAELLMPEKLLIRAVHRRQSKKSDYSSNELINDLAAEFQVSPLAMEYRLANLGMLMPQ